MIHKTRPPHVKYVLSECFFRLSEFLLVLRDVSDSAFEESNPITAAS